MADRPKPRDLGTVTFRGGPWDGRKEPSHNPIGGERGMAVGYHYYHVGRDSVGRDVGGETLTSDETGEYVIASVSGTTAALAEWASRDEEGGWSSGWENDPERERDRRFRISVRQMHGAMGRDLTEEELDAETAKMRKALAKEKASD